VDEARIAARGGEGGHGCVSFQREKYRPKGGPDGGDGGNGGSVILRVTPGVATLSELARRPHRRAEGGGNGSGDNRHGAAGADLVVPVPEGTLVVDAATGAAIADLVAPGDGVVVARGGRGGRGNASLASRRRKAPRFAERGEEAEERLLALELRLLADVGLVGLPNAGKSSLISRLSAARPKVAAYPFTTLTPNLGVAEADGVRFVVADVPGLVEGAAQGRGLGHAFLRHLRRCSVLCFVIDAAEGDARATLEALRAELGAYDPGLAARPWVAVANKVDLLDVAPPAGLVPVSALTGEGVEALAETLAGRVGDARASRAAEESHAMITIRPAGDDVEVLKEEGGYRVRSSRAERLVARFDLSNPDAVSYVQERLIALGVEDALSAAGAREGDEVRIGGAAFEFIPERAS
jgi:GTP-binding protein